MTLQLSPEQQRVISHRGTDVQVVACAGSGKTESISRRVAALIAEGEPPDSIIAFTFTEKAAVELKDRIYQRVEEVKGTDFLGRLGPMYVGTIHGYCFRLLQDYVPKYGNYEVLDENRHVGLLSREFQNLGLKNIGVRHWEPIRDFAKTVDVISNELIDPASLSGTPLGDCYHAYLDMLDRYHFLSFGLIVGKAIESLHDPVIYDRVHSRLRHLIVDEYQDVNPAQEKLVELLGAAPVQVCVVGDDDQSIYQWRGSDVANILTFAKRRPNVEVIKLESNRRSRPEIVTTANAFAQTIPQRLDKEMQANRPAGSPEIVTWCDDTQEDEARQIAQTIQRLYAQGYRYRDMAILYRSVRTSAPGLVDVLEQFNIPFSCGGRTGLFIQPAVNHFGELMAWFADGSWKDERYGQQRDASLDNVVAGLNAHFGNGGEIPGLRKYLEDWKAFRLRNNRPISLVGDFYRLLNFLGAHEIDVDTPLGSALFGSFARFSELLADFEHVTRRGRYVTENGERVFRGGQDRGKPYYQKLHNYLLHYARDAYEDFEGEEISGTDSVSILTVHQSKGLEWPVVFMPALTSQRFPSKFAGQSQTWLLPETVFPVRLRQRYEGGDADERRLFYVAMTRARDVVYLSNFQRISKATKPSPYLKDVAERTGGIRTYDQLPIPAPPSDTKQKEAPPLELSFSDIATFEDCGFRYRLGKLFGFQQELAIELGYGKALHHVLRQVAEQARSTGEIPNPTELTTIIDEEFYLPFADNPTFTRMHKASGMLVKNYVKDYSSDLRRVWEIERPFEVHLEDGILAGRADIILDMEDGKIGKLAIVDYKTATDPVRDERYHLQLAVYAAAGRGEGLDVSAGYLHELRDGTRHEVDISDAKTSAALTTVTKSVKGIRGGTFIPCCLKEQCERCDYKLVCKHNAAPSDAI
ncbi:ATP-dependent DNA helicase PcrA [Geobacter sp. OR-1]|uniref:ATP-dependent helicase n=1 Tax=Geobacter sp. OR-1 TaxID=1266765 RepID=UPI0005420C63|nr:ATP-dependent DNA helicase [Geobacter sp. OR-1]GAM10434.1 ATP-dependent DNA helicase PcrA [Geobacter sp. OR-1]